MGFFSSKTVIYNSNIEMRSNFENIKYLNNKTRTVILIFESVEVCNYVDSKLNWVFIRIGKFAEKLTGPSWYFFESQLKTVQLILSLAG